MAEDQDKKSLGNLGEHTSTYTNSIPVIENFEQVYVKMEYAEAVEENDCNRGHDQQGFSLNTVNVQTVSDCFHQTACFNSELEVKNKQHVEDKVVKVEEFESAICPSTSQETSEGNDYTLSLMKEPNIVWDKSSGVTHTHSNDVFDKEIGNAEEGHLKAHSDEIQTNMSEKDHTTKIYTCHLCNYSNAFKGRVKAHVDAVHYKLLKFSCHLCDFCSAYKAHVHKHINAVHHKLKINCNMCEYSANDENNLKRHIDVVHLKLKNFSCHLCSYIAHSKSTLKTHIDAIHHKLTNFSCSLCEYSSAYKHKLKRHIDSVHNKLRFNCDLCEYSAASKYSLRKHVDKSHHVNN